jgi:hypothetical protein
MTAPMINQAAWWNAVASYCKPELKCMRIGCDNGAAWFIHFHTCKDEHACQKCVDNWLADAELALARKVQLRCTICSTVFPDIESICQMRRI